MVNYFYKITNELNGHFYYGVHKTNNINDGYMGSGKRLKYAIKKYGKEKFKKEFVAFFDTYQEALDLESEIVNEELIKNPNCYNLSLQGKGTLRQGPPLRNKITGELINPPSIEEFNKLFHTNLYEGIIKNKVIVRDADGNKFAVDRNDPRYISGELVFMHKNRFIAKDKEGHIFMANCDDPRFASGEIVGSTKNNKLKESHKQKISIKNKLSQLGNKNSQYGTKWFWIYNDNLKIKKKIKPEFFEEYQLLGWKRGMK